MNIKDATKHIKNTVRAYIEKDETGENIIPVNKQRPIFLYGPPGIGKTAVMEQIAAEMNIGIVSYSMTHHTRQSALGLPFIKTKIFDGKEYSVSEFTMSEILSDVYSFIESEGYKQGILFLDEINCVSETLAPSMLRFLQYKSFGSHKVPDGWVIVTAGNPPEYNKSVKEYDIATLDRIQKIEVSADYDVWREYAINENIHPSIITYLDSKPTDFYIIENTPDGKYFVTARGWEDLSRLMYSFEKNNIEIDAEFISQYIQIPSVAGDFSSFYKVFKKLTEMCPINDIFSADYKDEHITAFKNLQTTEKLGFINLLTNKLNENLKENVLVNKSIKEFAEILKQENIFNLSFEDALKSIENIKRVNSKTTKLFLSEFKSFITPESDIKKDVKEFLSQKLSDLKENISKSQTALGNTSVFLFNTTGDSPEIKIFISNITRNEFSAEFLIGFGCEEFNKITNAERSAEEILADLNSLI